MSDVVTRAPRPALSEAELIRQIVQPCMRQMGQVLRACVPWSMPSLLEQAVTERMAREVRPNVQGLAQFHPVWFGQFAGWLGVEADVEAVHEELRLRAVCLQTRRLWRAEARMSGRRPIWVLPSRRGVESSGASGASGASGSAGVARDAGVGVGRG